MITHYYSNARSRQLEIVERPKVGSWCHVIGPTEEELGQIAKDFDLEIDLLKDATDLYEAPRIEIDEGITYVFTRYCHPEGKDVATEPLLIVYTPNNIVTILRHDNPVLDRLIQGKVEVLTTQKTKTFLRIIDQINRSYKLQLNFVGRRVLQIRSKLRGSGMSKTDLIGIIELEEDLNEFLTALQPQGAVLVSLRTGRYMRLYEEDKDLIEDLLLNSTELTEITKSRLLSLVNIRQAYDTIATDNLNRIFKRLTSIGIFLSVPMIFSGLWGMNVGVPFANDRLGFWKVFLLTGLTTFFTVLYFRKKKWL